ncbi:MAG: GTPase Era [Chloroflexota bacterium]|nr:MAG: GTPase Era [Chloroflexota bacterium]
MSLPAEWPPQFEDDELDDEGPFLDDSLPPGHHSGFVAVVGRPNVGKSTLLNRLLSQKIAIVSPKPQTTRNQLLGILSTSPEFEPDLPPAQVIFVDTPGIHQPHHKLGEYLVETALAALPDADVVVWLVDASEPPTEEDRLVAAALRDNLGATPAETAVLLALNKVDLLPPTLSEAELAQPFLELYPASEWLKISATRGDNQMELLGRIIDHLPLGPRYFPEDQITDQQTRFIAAEFIREAALKVLHQEVPHALAVRITEFKPRSERMTYISADLIIERNSQKAIVIGEKGKSLKKIGQIARPQIEELVGTQVYLELWVKVRPKWRQKEDELRWLGYALE